MWHTWNMAIDSLSTIAITSPPGSKTSAAALMEPGLLKLMDEIILPY
jgi:hypothetical protein